VSLVRVLILILMNFFCALSPPPAHSDLACKPSSTNCYWLSPLRMSSSEEEKGEWGEESSEEEKEEEQEDGGSGAAPSSSSSQAAGSGRGKKRRARKSVKERLQERPKRKKLSVEEKVEILDAYKKGLNKSQISRQYSITRMTVNNTLVAAQAIRAVANRHSKYKELKE